MNTSAEVSIKTVKYPDQARYIKKRKEQDPDFKKKLYQQNIQYRKNRYLTDEIYREKIKEYSKNKMKEYRERLKQIKQ